VPPATLLKTLLPLFTCADELEDGRHFDGLLSEFMCVQESEQKCQIATHQQCDDIFVYVFSILIKQEKEFTFYIAT
jgi:hypothetical protein